MAAGSDSTSNLRTVLQEKVKGKKFLILGILTAAIVVTISIVISIVCVFVQNEQQKGIYKGRKVYDDGIYIGEFKDGKKEGFGRAEFYNGDVYVGQWKNDSIEGNGTYKFGNKSDINPGGAFVGVWKAGRKECTGSYTYLKYPDAMYTGDIKTLVDPNGTTSPELSSYLVAWKDGVQEGFGHFIYGNGDVYVGDFKNDSYEGQGRLEKKAASTFYTGSFKNNLYDGHGVEEYKSGGVLYNGTWKKGKPDGFGLFNYKNGDVYIGEFKAGDESGQGIHYFKDGEIHNGTYAEGLKHGKGWYKDDSGRITIGQYAFDSAIGVHKSLLPNGTYEMLQAYQNENGFWFSPLDYITLYLDPRKSGNVTTETHQNNDF